MRVFNVKLEEDTLTRIGKRAHELYLNKSDYLRKLINDDFAKADEVIKKI